MKFIILAGCLSLLASCSSSNYSRKIASEEERRDIYRIGEIKISLLKPEDFRAVYGTAWVLMDGSTQVSSDFAKMTGMNRLPDARGAFLRMHNNGRNDGYQNPDNKELGDFQADEFRSHTHSLASSIQGNYAKNDFYSGPKSGGSTTGAAGGNETRPKNITVNYYVKVSYCSGEINCL